MVERNQKEQMKSDIERAGTPAVAVQRLVSQPHRVKLSRKKGWRLPPNTVVVARPTKSGKPFQVCDVMDAFEGDKTKAADDCVRSFEKWLQGEGYGVLLGAKVALRGKNLACWCDLDAPCHADVLLRLANDSSSPTAGGGSGGAQPKGTNEK